MPGKLEAFFNRLLGGLVSLGFGPRDIMQLDVVGRVSGRTHSTPVNVLRHEGKLYLVAPRGRRTQWVRNVEVVGTVVLRKGKSVTRFTLAEIPAIEKPVILKNYLENYKGAVQRYFPVEAGSPESEFAPICDRVPVYELAVARADTPGARPTSLHRGEPDTSTLD